MFGNILSGANSLKDKGVSFAIKRAVNIYLEKEGYGEMLKLNLDSQNKTLEAEIMLKGEKEPLEVKVGNYELFEENGKKFIRLKDIHTSREWIDILAGSYIEGKSFEIPKQYADKLEMII